MGKLLRKNKGFVAGLLFLLMAATLNMSHFDSEAWNTPTYGTSNSGYHLYVRKTTGSTLLGIMSLTRNSVGVYNDFTPNVVFTYTVEGFVGETSSTITAHLSDSALYPGHVLHVQKIITDHVPVSVYGYMSFLE